MFGLVSNQNIVDQQSSLNSSNNSQKSTRFLPVELSAARKNEFEECILKIVKSIRRFFESIATCFEKTLRSLSEPKQVKKTQFSERVRLWHNELRQFGATLRGIELQISLVSGHSSNWDQLVYEFKKINADYSKLRRELEDPKNRNKSNTASVLKIHDEIIRLTQVPNQPAQLQKLFGQYRAASQQFVNQLINT
ncbi:MAG: hypothetical protein V4494_06440 [Chlamydiota bacterium]